MTAKSDRERQIADFSAGRVSVMISMIILAEGFDCPALQTVFCRPSGRLCTVRDGGPGCRAGTRAFPSSRWCNAPRRGIRSRAGPRRPSNTSGAMPTAGAR